MLVLWKIMLPFDNIVDDNLGLSFIEFGSVLTWSRTGMVLVLWLVEVSCTVFSARILILISVDWALDVWIGLVSYPNIGFWLGLEFGFRFGFLLKRFLSTIFLSMVLTRWVYFLLVHTLQAVHSVCQLHEHVYHLMIHWCHQTSLIDLDWWQTVA